LTAAGVVGDGQHDQRHLVRAAFLDQAFQRLQIHIALEWMRVRQHFGFGTRQIDGLGAEISDIRPRRIEVAVARHRMRGLTDGAE
jgi:hypothetical protein